MATDSPLRIEGLRLSSCCSWPTVVVQSMKGGFVTQNCIKCGSRHSLSETDFFYRLHCAVDCPACGDRMFKTYLWKNYGFECPTCRRTLLLVDLVPRYDDVAPFKTERALPSALHR